MRQRDTGGRQTPSLAFWGRARALAERLPLPPDRFAPDMSPDWASRAAQRLKRWRETFGPDDALYAEALRSAGVTESDLLYLLGEGPDELCGRLLEPPAWLRAFRDAFETAGQPAEPQRGKAPETATRPDLVRMRREYDRLPERDRAIHLPLAVVDRLVCLGRDTVFEGLEELRDSPSGLTLDRARLIESLLLSLVARLERLLARTVILEFRIAQRQGIVPSTDTLKDSLDAYARHLRRDSGALEFFHEYPVLARLATTCVERWSGVNLEMLVRLDTDWPEVRAVFCRDPDPGSLLEIEGNVGDTHRGGRSVQILHFASGLRLVYKPRSLAVDKHFQELLRWLNVHGQSPAFRDLRVLDRGNYGWSEWIQWRECESVEELHRFYERQGANLAVLYAMGARDVHFENVVAPGEHPVLVDLETLVSPDTELPVSALSPAERLANQTVTSSVLSTLLLPLRLPGDASEDWSEISGLGGAPGQIMPSSVARLQGFDTGELRYEREHAVLQGGNNRPALNGQVVDLREYLGAVRDGFASTYRLLLAHRTEALARGGPVAPFEGDTIRVIMRATAHYAALLQAGLHPYMLHDELDRDRLRNTLWRLVEARPHFRRLVPYEQADLCRGDVPYFTTRADSHDLWTGSGERISGFLVRSGFELLQSRWQKLSEGDLERQIWFIDASFATLAIDGTEANPNPSAHPIPAAAESNSVRSALHSDLLTAACAIGDRLCELATWAGSTATWLSVDQSQRRPWIVGLADLNLYGGLAGIILALAYLGDVTSDEKYTRLAKAGYATVRERLANAGQALGDIGFYVGLGGVVGVLAHMGMLWQDDEPLGLARVLVDKLTPLIDQDNHLDHVQGCAGTIAGLLCLDAVERSERVEIALRRCGERLVASAIPLPMGVGWRAIDRAEPLSGLAHGAAGFAWALLKLSERTADVRYRSIAEAALAYERSLFDPQYKNWRDLRRLPRNAPLSRARFAVAWCHGAPGIGLARLDTLPIFDTTEVRAEIHAAVETTIAQGFGGSHALCHGDFGNIEFLHRAQRRLPDAPWQAVCDLIMASLLESGRQSGWSCGTPERVETPGLMLGLAGICMELLRLAEPDRVPTMLTMDPPPMRERPRATPPRRPSRGSKARLASAQPGD